MPWTSRDARRFTKKASSIHARRVWAKTANSVLERTGDEGAAIKAANAAVKRHKKRVHL